MAVPWKQAPIAAINTPPIKTGRRPSLTINKDAGKVVSIIATNCSDSPNVRDGVARATDTD